MYFSRVQIRSDIKELSEISRILKDDTHGLHRMLWSLFPEQEARTFIYREEIAREQLSPLPAARGQPVYYLVSKHKPDIDENSLFKVESKDYQPQLFIGQKLQFDCRVNPVITRHNKKHDVVMDEQLTFLQTLLKAYQLDSLLSVKHDKGEYKKLLLANGGAELDSKLTQLLKADSRYAERLDQITTLSDKLEWAIKAQIDAALENWLKRQGERFGFSIAADHYGALKLQNSAYIWHGLPHKTKLKDKKSGFSSVDFSGELEVTDPAKFEQALYQGIGRSKAFGCGLLLVRRV